MNVELNTLQTLCQKHPQLLWSLSPYDKAVSSYLKKESDPLSIHSSLTTITESIQKENQPFALLEKLRELLSLTLISSLANSEALTIQDRLKEMLGNIPNHVFWREFQASKVLLDLIYSLLSVSTTLQRPQLLSSGAVPLESGGHWSWGEIPHMRYQAELGVYWALMHVVQQTNFNATSTEYLLAAENAAEWQLNGLDYHFASFSGLFNVENESAISQLCLNYLLFSAIAILKQSRKMQYVANKQMEYIEKYVQSGLLQIPGHFLLLEEFIQKMGSKPAPETHHLAELIADKDTGLIGVRSEQKSLVCTGFGGKTGLGCLNYKQLQIVSYGPQHLPLGDCRGYGIEGGLYTSHKIEMQSDLNKSAFKIQHTSRMAAKPIVSHSLAHFNNGQRCNTWLDVVQEYKHDLLTIHTSFLGTVSDELAFTFFVKAKSCEIDEQKVLLPRTFERYKGSPSTISFTDGSQKLLLETPHQLGEMQVIPLGGGESFWGADFLIAYLFNYKSHQQYTWQVKEVFQ